MVRYDTFTIELPDGQYECKACVRYYRKRNFCDVLWFEVLDPMTGKWIRARGSVMIIDFQSHRTSIELRKLAKGK